MTKNDDTSTPQTRIRENDSDKSNSKSSNKDRNSFNSNNNINECPYTIDAITPGIYLIKLHQAFIKSL